MSSSSYSLNNVNPRLLRKIYRACKGHYSEPNLALNLEICDYVNEKQGSLPREAAIVIVKVINSSDPQGAELAIALLDNLVKNCGYPFQLQISRKEFLNELVKRFPERPPARYTRTQRLILGAIEEWYQTICRTSRYKEDFNYIRDMHRLLYNKGYVFPQLKLEDAAVLNPSDNLKSMEEIQKEEKIVQSAKLQELIRRGKPNDLQEANKLMKIMAGFKEDSLEESKHQIQEDLSRLKRKVDIFSEMLTQIQSESGTIDNSNEALNELYSSLKVSQPKISKIIEEEGENEEQVNELLRLNDKIHSLVEKYDYLKKGDVVNAANVKVNNSTSNDLINLIDFDDAPANSNEQEKITNDLLTDLSSLSFTNNGGSIELTSSPVPVLDKNLSNLNDLYAQSGLRNSITPSSNISSISNQSVTSPQPSSKNILDPFGFDFPQSTPSPIITNSSAVAVTEKIAINKSTNLEIEFDLQKLNNFELSINSFFSNLSSVPITNFQFLVAVPKNLKLELQPQSDNKMGGYAKNGITQVFKVIGLNSTSIESVKMKWKVNYNVNNSPVEETGITVLKN